VSSDASTNPVTAIAYRTSVVKRPELSAAYPDLSRQQLCRQSVPTGCLVGRLQYNHWILKRQQVVSKAARLNITNH
jgi:hypothetical protein